jgi:hypothetical protein
VEKKGLVSMKGDSDEVKSSQNEGYLIREPPII